MIIEGGNDALRLDINVDRYGKPVKVRDQRHRNSCSMSHRNGPSYMTHRTVKSLNKGRSIEC